MKWNPHDYQKNAIKFLISHGCAGLFLDPGLGKTSISLAAFTLLRKQGLVNRMLVIAPLRPAYSVWPAEAAKWDEFKDLTMHVIHGPNKQELLNTPHDISVINPEGLPRLFQQPGARWDMLVIDESTKFKHTNTQRFKNLRPQLSKFRRRYILTGTPAPNGLLDLFGQIYILDQGNALGKFITHFRTTYYNPTGYGGYEWVLKAGSEEKIYEQLRPLVLRMSGEDYLKLPPLINNTVEVELPESACEAYRDMENELIIQLQSGEITAANAAAASIKCRQIANGGIYHGDGEKFTNLHEAKIEAIQEIIEELSGKPALIAYEFRHDLERLRKAFPGTPYLGGGVTPKEQARVEAAWNAGDLPLLFAQPQSVAHGLNLQGVGAAVIWHSLTWDLELYEQFVRRVWRQGQKERVIVHHIVAKNTIDQVIMRGLASKDRTQKALLSALKTHFTERSPKKVDKKKRAGISSVAG